VSPGFGWVALGIAPDLRRIRHTASSPGFKAEA
jgi:hypothetical protein